MSGKELGFQLDDIEARFALIQQKVGEFPAVLEQLDAVVAEFEGTTDEDLKAMEPKELDTQRSALNKQIKAVRDLRAAIGKAYDEPKKALYKAVDERLALADSLLADCDRVRDMNKQAKLEQRKAGLESYYSEVAGVLADYVAFDAIYDPDWVKSDAKYKAAFDTICDKCKRLADDWAALRKMHDSLYDFNAAERMLFRTFDLRATMDADEQAKQADEERKAMKADLGMEEDYEPPAFEEAEPEQPVEGVGKEMSIQEQQYRKLYSFKVWLSGPEVFALKAWKNENCIGMGWSFKEVE